MDALIRIRFNKNGKIGAKSFFLPIFFVFYSIEFESPHLGTGHFAPLNNVIYFLILHSIVQSMGKDEFHE